MNDREDKVPSKQALEEMEQYTQDKHEELEPIKEVNVYDVRIAELETQLLEAQQHQLNEHNNLLRTKAEMENLRRRTQLDIEKAHKFALEKFSTDLLSVIDNLERALDLVDKNNPALTSMIEGIELTLKSLQDVIYKYNIKIIEDVNIPFNPDIHQAMSLIESTEHQENNVIMVMQKGYMLNGRLLRPAMVVVSKAKPQGENPKEAV